MKDELLSMIKKAMLSKNEVELRTLRLIKTKFTEFETSKDDKPLTPDAEIDILKKMVKERNDSIEKYTEAGRLDLVKQEQDECNFISTFIPKQITEEELKNSIIKIKELNNLTDMKGMGCVMTNLKTQYGSTFDAKSASDIYKSLI